MENDFEFEKHELAKIYRERGLDGELSIQVAEQLMEHDALGAHARDEIGISHTAETQPVLAAFSSAGTFIIGAALPLLVAWLISGEQQILFVAISSLMFLALLGAIAARTGGASITVGAFRVTFWGALAMAMTAGVGRLFGVAV